MTRQAFYKLLSKTTDDFKWFLDNSYSIRAYHKDDTLGWFPYNPITAVAKLTTGRKYQINRWKRAARRIDLSPDYAQRIQESSNANIYPFYDKNFGSARIYHHLRKTLHI